jgi:hypothetical protein
MISSTAATSPTASDSARRTASLTGTR